jgi:hypothetical protein
MTNGIKDTADLATATALDGNSLHDLKPGHSTTRRAAENGSQFQRKERLRGRLKGALVHVPVSNAMSAGTAAPEPMAGYVAADAPDKHKIVRAGLLGEIEACNDADELARTIAPRLDQATRGDDDALLRGDVKSAVAKRLKQLNHRKLSRAEIETLFPKSWKMRCTVNSGHRRFKQPARFF